jgi:hypothetical protein
LFFLFNLSGLLFLTLGIKEEIGELVTGAAFIIFVSYILIISYLTDKYFQKEHKGKDEEETK